MKTRLRHVLVPWTTMSCMTTLTLVNDQKQLYTLLVQAMKHQHLNLFKYPYLSLIQYWYSRILHRHISMKYSNLWSTNTFIYLTCMILILLDTSSVHAS